jgi:hypothetical protein
MMSCWNIRGQESSLSLNDAIFLRKPFKSPLIYLCQGRVVLSLRSFALRKVHPLQKCHYRDGVRESEGNGSETMPPAGLG